MTLRLRPAAAFSLSLLLLGTHLAAQAPQSLQLAPADCGFYSAMLRNREQCQRLRNSRVYGEVLNSPYVQLALAQVKLQWQDENSPIAPFRKGLEQPENKELVAVLREMVAEEVFFCGDEGLAAILEMVNRFNGVVRGAQLEAATQGRANQQVLAEKMLQLFTSFLQEHDVPSTVIGFRLADEAAAQRQIARLEKLATAAFEGGPLANRIGRSKIAGADFLTLSLDGTLIPVEKMLEGMSLEGDATEIGEQFGKQLKQEKLLVSLGIKKNFVLLHIGGSTRLLEQFGKQPLASQKEIKKLDRHMDQKVVSVGYVGAKFLGRIGASQGQQLKDMAQLFQQATAQAPLSENIKKELKNDLAKLSNAASQIDVKVGALSSVSFLTDRGTEGYTYHFGPSLRKDQRLKVLQHVGGDSPILLAAGGGQPAAAAEPNKEEADYWAGRAKFYLEEGLLPQLPPAQRDLVRKAVDKGLPILKRVGAAFSKKIGPGLEGAGGAFVIDTQLESNSLHFAMPKSEKPLPIPEFAMVLTVKDSQLVLEGAREVYDAGDDLIALAREFNPQIPPFTIPRAQRRQTNNGNVYEYKFPPFIGIDAAFAPNAGLSPKALVFSFTPATTERMLASREISLPGLAGQYQDKPLTSLVYFNSAKLFDSIHRWVDYGFAQADGDDPAVEVIHSQVKLAFRVLSCMRSLSAATYHEDGVLVTHSEWHVRDLAD